MVLTVEDRILIRELREHKGYGAKRLLKEFPMKQWSLASVSRLLKQINDTGSSATKERGGRRRSSRTADNIQSVEQLVLSQEDAPGTHRTLREISRETGMSRASVHRAVHHDLQLKCLKKRPGQELTAANKLSRLSRAKSLLRKYPSHQIQFMWFTDEKVFTVASPRNAQNDRLYVPVATKKRHVSAARQVFTRSTFSKSVMVSLGVSLLGSTELFFVEPGVKINGAYYRDVLLGQQLLPAIREQSGEHFIFQQDGAPSHRAYETVEMLRRETPSFIPPSLWPPNSPDLNPVDYKIWGVLQSRVYRTRVSDIEHLKQRLVEEWSRFDQSIIDGAIRQWRQRLQACVRAAGGHFEHKMCSS
jgi:transposase